MLAPQYTQQELERAKAAILLMLYPPADAKPSDPAAGITKSQFIETIKHTGINPAGNLGRYIAPDALRNKLLPNPFRAKREATIEALKQLQEKGLIEVHTPDNNAYQYYEIAQPGKNYVVQHLCGAQLLSFLSTQNNSVSELT